MDAITLERDTDKTIRELYEQLDAAKQRVERRERMAALMVRRRTGNVGDLGQADMFGGNVNLFNR